MKSLSILIFIVCIDVVLVLGSFSMHQINPDSDGFFNYNNSLVQSFDSGEYVLNNTYADYLPVDEGSVTQSGNIFTDTFRSARSWISAGNTAINVVSILFFGPAVYLNAILPAELSIVTFLVAVLWFLTTLFIVVSWIFGRT